MLIKRSREGRMPRREIQVLFAPGKWGSSNRITGRLCIRAVAATAACSNRRFLDSPRLSEAATVKKRCRMKTKRKMRIETLAVHAGHAIDPATGAVATPIHLSTTFERDAEGGYPARIQSTGGARTRRAMRSKKAWRRWREARTRRRLVPAWPRRARSCKRWRRAIMLSRRPMFITG